MSWRRLRVLVTHLPRDSALWRDIYGDDAQWGLPEQLQAATVDGINLMIWQNGSGKKADRPKRIPRPGVTDDDKKVTRIVPKVVRTPAEIDALLARAATHEEVTPSPSSSPPPT